MRHCCVVVLCGCVSLCKGPSSLCGHLLLVSLCALPFVAQALCVLCICTCKLNSTRGDGCMWDIWFQFAAGVPLFPQSSVTLS
jgi:hypothetical protein